jgi:F-type H+-transporting ATPase subunit b
MHAKPMGPHNETRKRRARLLAFPVLLAAAPLFAAAGAWGAEHGAAQLPTLTQYWVNFLIYFFGLCYILKGALPAAWAQRRGQIARDVERAQGELASAKEKLASAEARLAQVDADARALAQNMRAETAREAQEIQADAERRSQNLLQQARLTAAAERESGEKAIRQDVVERAVARAEERLRRELADEQDRAIRNSTLEGIGALTE